MRYRFIQAHRTGHRLSELCRTPGVSRSGYYAWRTRPASARATANARLLVQIQQLHQETKARYGAVKVWHALRLAGVRCGRHRVARLRRQHGLLAQRSRRFRVMIERHEFAPPALTDSRGSWWRRRSIASGRAISRRSQPAPGGCISRSCWICIRGASSAGP